MADPTTAQAPLAAGGDGGQAFDSESAAPPSALPGLGDEEYEEIANKVRALREDYRDYVLYMGRGASNSSVAVNRTRRKTRSRKELTALHKSEKVMLAEIRACIQDHGGSASLEAIHSRFDVTDHDLARATSAGRWSRFAHSPAECRTKIMELITLDEQDNALFYKDPFSEGEVQYIASHRLGDFLDMEGFWGTRDTVAERQTDDEYVNNLLRNMIIRCINIANGRAHFRDINFYVYKNAVRNTRGDEILRNTVRTLLATDSTFVREKGKSEYYTLNEAVMKGGSPHKSKKRKRGLSPEEDERSAKIQRFYEQSRGASKSKKKKHASDPQMLKAQSAAVISMQVQAAVAAQAAAAQAAAAGLPHGMHAMHGMHGMYGAGMGTVVEEEVEEEEVDEEAERRKALFHSFKQPPPGYRCICGTSQAGRASTYKWRRGRFGEFLCHRCSGLAQLANTCPVCRTDSEDEENPWICCDACSRWVHSRCDSITDLTLYDDENPDALTYNCPFCRGEAKEDPVATEEERILAIFRHGEGLLEATEVGAWVKMIEMRGDRVRDTARMTELKAQEKSVVTEISKRRSAFCQRTLDENEVDLVSPFQDFILEQLNTIDYR